MYIEMIDWFIRHPISIKYKYEVSNQKLLVSINQSNSDNLIYFYYKFFNKVKETNI